MDIIDGSGLWSVTEGAAPPAPSAVVMGSRGVIILASDSEDLRRKLLAQNLSEEEVLLVISLMEF